MKDTKIIRSRSWNTIYEGLCVHLQSLNYAVNKYGMYQSYARECISWLENRGITSIEHVHSNDVLEYIAYIRQRPHKRSGGTLAPSTITHHIFSVKLLFDFCYTCKLINYTIPYPKVVVPKRKITDILTIDEIRLVFRACENPRDTALLTLLYGCGLRRSEAHWMDSADVHTHHRCVYVQEGKGRKFRKIPLSTASVDYLRDYERTYRPLLLKKRVDHTIEPAFLLNNNGCRMQGDGMYKRLLYLVQQTHDTELQKKHITPHTLRHSIATHLTELHVDLSWIQAFLGHSTPDSTHIYTRNKKKYVPLY